MTNKQREVIQFLATGATLLEVCAKFGIRKHTIKRWKEGSQEFRDAWNKIMTELGRVYPY